MTMLLHRGDWRALWRAGLLTAITDGLFAVVLNVYIYRSVSFTRLWQVVASVPLGKGARDGGAWTAAAGLAVHCAVAFFWTGVFLLLLRRTRWLRELVTSPRGVAQVASVYGPLVWVIMSLVAIPLTVHRPPVITPNWWVQLVGHFPFVGLPIVAGAVGVRRDVAARSLVV